MIQNNIGLFALQGTKSTVIYFEESAIIGRWIGKNKKRLIYGGVNVGLMEATRNTSKNTVDLIPGSLHTASGRLWKGQPTTGLADKSRHSPGERNK